MFIYLEILVGKLYETNFMVIDIEYIQIDKQIDRNGNFWHLQLEFTIKFVITKIQENFMWDLRLDSKKMYKLKQLSFFLLTKIII